MNLDLNQNADRRGLVIVNTGDGKGKTTAALGMLLRAWGREMRVCVLQFLKSGEAPYGELLAAQRLGIEITPVGDGCTWESRDLAQSRQRAAAGWAEAQARITSGQYDVIVLDEFTYPLQFRWLPTAEVVDWLAAHRPADLHLVITGRNAPPALIAYADLVTEMCEIKHPYRQGVLAQPGVEF